MYLFFTGFVVDVLELCQDLPVFHRFCGGIFGALSKSTCCSQVLWWMFWSSVKIYLLFTCFGAMSKSSCFSQV